MARGRTVIWFLFPVILCIISAFSDNDLIGKASLELMSGHILIVALLFSCFINSALYIAKVCKIINAESVLASCSNSLLREMYSFCYFNAISALGLTAFLSTYNFYVGGMGLTAAKVIFGSTILLSLAVFSRALFVAVCNDKPFPVVDLACRALYGCQHGKEADSFRVRASIAVMVICCLLVWRVGK